MSWPPEVPTQFNSMGDPMPPGQVVGRGAWMPPMEATVTGDIAMPGGAVGTGEYMPPMAFTQSGDIGPTQPVFPPDPMAEAARAHAGLARRGAVPLAPYEPDVRPRVRPTSRPSRAKDRRPAPSPFLPSTRPKSALARRTSAPERHQTQRTPEKTGSWGRGRLLAVVLTGAAMAMLGRAVMQDEDPRGTVQQEYEAYLLDQNQEYIWELSPEETEAATLPGNPNVRVMDDGTELPCIIGQDPAQVGPATIETLNYWLRTDNTQALGEFRGESLAQFEVLQELFGMQSITPGVGSETPVWMYSTEEQPGSDGRVTKHIYHMQGAYFANTQDEAMPLRPATGPKPFVFSVEITEYEDRTDITDLGVRYMGDEKVLG